MNSVPNNSNNSNNEKPRDCASLQPPIPRSFMQVNGRKVLVPPENWHGPVPSAACELFVRRIPKDFCDEKLIKAFSRFGSIYELRVPMDFSQANRGFAYVKYTNEEDASCALEVLSHYFILPGVKLQALRSYEKNRLFISNIPKKLSNAELEQQLRTVFPTMVKISARGGSYVKKNQSHNGENSSSNDSNSNNVGGFVIIDFLSHADALEAKKSTSPGLIRLWGRDLKVVWALNDQDPVKKSTNLFVRNVDLTVNISTLGDIITRFVPRDQVLKVSKVRNTAFFNFHSKEAAEFVLKNMQGTIVNGQRLALEWARPSSQQSIHQLASTDFDAVLRLKCIANFWQIPIVIFGTYYHLEGIQYAAVILRKEGEITRAIFCAMKTVELADIHSRLCEVVNALIEKIGGYPEMNYLIYVENDSAHILGKVSHNDSINFHAAHNVPREFNLNTLEIIDLSCAVAALSPIPEEILLAIYYESFRCKPYGSFIPNVIICGQRIFGTIVPNYRNREPLRYNLNDAQIILALCYMATGNNISPPNRAYTTTHVYNFDGYPAGIPYLILKLLPITLVQSRYQAKTLLSQVVFDGNKQLVMQITSNYPDIHPKAVPYRVSIKNPTHRDFLNEQAQRQQMQAQLASQELQTQSPIVQQQQLLQNIEDQLSPPPVHAQQLQPLPLEALAIQMDNLTTQTNPIHIVSPTVIQQQSFNGHGQPEQQEAVLQSDQVSPDGSVNLQQEPLLQSQESVQQQQSPIQHSYVYPDQFNYAQSPFPISGQYVLFDHYNPYVFPNENGNFTAITAPYITYPTYTNN